MNTDFKLFIQNGLSAGQFLVNFVSNAILSLVGSLAVLVLIKDLAAISFLIFNYQ